MSDEPKISITEDNDGDVTVADCVFTRDTLPDNQGAGIGGDISDVASLTVTGCDFSDLTYGVSVELWGELDVNNCEFEDMAYGVIARDNSYLGHGGSADISDNTFTNCEGEAILTESTYHELSSLVVDSNTFIATSAQLEADHIELTNNDAYSAESGISIWVTEAETGLIGGNNIGQELPGYTGYYYGGELVVWNCGSEDGDFIISNNTAVKYQYECLEIVAGVNILIDNNVFTLTDASTSNYPVKLSTNAALRSNNYIKFIDNVFEQGNTSTWYTRPLGSMIGFPQAPTLDYSNMTYVIDGGVGYWELPISGDWSYEPEGVNEVTVEWYSVEDGVYTSIGQSLTNSAGNTMYTDYYGTVNETVRIEASKVPTYAGLTAQLVFKNVTSGLEESSHLNGEGADAAIDIMTPRITAIGFDSYSGMRYTREGTDTSWNQLSSIPMNSTKTVTITFSRPDLAASAALLDPSILTVESADGNTTKTGVSVHYDPTTDPLSVTWTLDTYASGADVHEWYVNLATTGIVAADGRQLDGEWTNPDYLGAGGGSTISGDGVEGGDFRYAFAMLAGDANGDGIADGSDITIIAGNWQSDVSAYDAFGRWTRGDFNLDGFVDGSDVTILAGNWQATAWL